ncbi:hypothetical protein J437_LFUL005312 [Ladona fulva]|uniref:Uncharacterized protein n=1 Tax=Ladona fulva TaxID=123851 RepID=A0A8K0K2G4_LADFU|nr:hypothetical protein J437_LFUL005312 [Ladona fulva]
MQKSSIMKGSGKDEDSTVAATAATMLVLGQPPPTAPHNNKQLLTIEWSMMDKSRFIPLSMLSSFTVRCLLYPLTLVKTRLQIQKRNEGSEEYRGLIDACRKIKKEEGVKGLYRGFWVGAFQIVSGVGYIATYESVRHALTMGGIQDSQIKALAGGGCASLVGQTIVVPSDVVSQHLMMLRSKKSTQSSPQSNFRASSAGNQKNSFSTFSRTNGKSSSSSVTDSHESRLANKSHIASADASRVNQNLNSVCSDGSRDVSLKTSSAGHGSNFSTGTVEGNGGGRGSANSCCGMHAGHAEKNGALFFQTQGKTRFQITADIVRQIYERDGLKGFYRGYGASLCTYVPNSALWWSFYHFYQDKLSAVLPPWVSHLFIQCISGSLGGFTTTIITNPIDIVRARLQVSL